jgi:tetratricopeptide (TPR) repeat protein
MPTLQELIKHPEQLTADTLPQLRQLTERYPYFQTARLLLLSNLFSLRHSDFGPELRKAALMLPDRSTLFRLAEGAQYDLPTPADNPTETIETETIETEGDTTPTLSLIDHYLEHDRQQPPTPPEQPQPSIADLTHDYTAFLQQMDDLPQTPATPGNPATPTGDIIDSFIKQTQTAGRITLTDLADDYTSPQISYEQEEVYTENMVNIYIRQGRYKQALEILRKICLNNPKKNTTFAAQIQLLEVILQEKN